MTMATPTSAATSQGQALRSSSGTTISTSATMTNPLPNRYIRIAPSQGQAQGQAQGQSITPALSLSSAQAAQNLPVSNLAISQNRWIRFKKICSSSRVGVVVGIIALGAGAYYYYGQYAISWKTWQLGIWKDCRDRQDISNTRACTYYENISYDSIISRNSKDTATVRDSAIVFGEGKFLSDIHLPSTRFDIHIRALLLLLDGVCLFVWVAGVFLVPNILSLTMREISFKSLFVFNLTAHAFVGGLFSSFILIRTGCWTLFAALVTTCGKDVLCCWRVIWNIEYWRLFGIMYIILPGLAAMTVLPHVILSYWAPEATLPFGGQLLWTTCLALLMFHLVLGPGRLFLKLVMEVPVRQNNSYQLLGNDCIGGEKDYRRPLHTQRGVEPLNEAGGTAMWSRLFTDSSAIIEENSSLVNSSRSLNETHMVYRLYRSKRLRALRMR
ncbi:hypothetical protein BDZ45DRAFT_741144 [Acephala macrosclerotiorum]|nr:hypothetical protein BDZ45DRAFT_741144 [Acephala macrosclerotiorum]